MRSPIVYLSSLGTVMLSVALGLTLPTPEAAAQPPSVDTVLGMDQPDCCHVIDLLMVNRTRQLAGHARPVGVDVLGGQPGDLELLSVNLLADATDTCGPSFHISFRNNSRWAVQNFRISIVGVLDRITPHAPCRSMHIPCIAAGETKCVEMQLPSRCLTMGPYGGPPRPFDILVVAIDSLDELVECDELNNVAIIRRAEIALVTQAAPAAPNTAVPAAPDAGTAAPDQAKPSENAQPAPVENIDFDKLDLDNAEETAMRIMAR